MTKNPTSTPVLWARITFRGSQGLVLSGMFVDGGSPVTAIHVHGACGNFFSAGYLEVLAGACKSGGVNLLSINTSGHDCISEGFRGEEYGYVGGSISPFQDCVEDIDGAVSKALTFSEKVVLVGHSLGCDRVTYYARETGSRSPLVLISPCDSYRLHKGFLGDREDVEEQVARLSRYPDSDSFVLLSDREYGIKNGSERYRIPVNKSTFLSIANGPPFSQFRVDVSPSFLLENRCLVCIGGKDSLQTATAAEMFAHISALFCRCEHFLAVDGDHEFAGVEDDLARHVVSWIVNWAST